MSLPLAEDEEVELELHPHWKALVLPAMVLVVTCGVASFLAAVTPPAGKTPTWPVIVGLAAVVVVLWSLAPFLRWRSSIFVLTTHRVVTREGVLSRRGRSVPLSRITDISFSHTLLDRILGCGTLVVESAGENEGVVLDDIPGVERVQTQLWQLVEGEPKRPGSDEGS